MLTLYRKPHEKIIISDGENKIVITYLERINDKIKLGFDAPAHITIDREELRIKKQKSIIR